MKSLFWIFIFCFIELGVASADPSNYKLKGYTTPGGHKFFYMQMDKAIKKSAVIVQWKTGLSSLPEGNEVAARMAVKLMLYGPAGGIAASKIAADFYKLEAGSNVFIEPDIINGLIKSPNQNLEKVARIVNLVLTKTQFGKMWFNSVKANTLKEANAWKVNEWGLVRNLAQRSLVSNTRYNNFWLVAPALKIEGIGRDVLEHWQRSAFIAKPMMIVGAGGAPVEKIAQSIDLALAGLPSTTAPKDIPFSGPKFVGKTIIFHKPDAKKSIMAIYGALPNGYAGKDIAIKLGVNVLGRNQQSRLFQVIRNKVGAGYGFYAQAKSMTHRYNVLTLSGEIDTNKLKESYYQIEEAYNNFKKDGISSLEFPFARDYYASTIESAFHNPESLAFMILNSQVFYRSKDSLVTLVERVQQAKREDINKTISTSFPKFSDMLKIIVTPDVSQIKGDCVIEKVEELQGCFKIK